MIVSENAPSPEDRYIVVPLSLRSHVVRTLEPLGALEVSDPSRVRASAAMLTAAKGPVNRLCNTSVGHFAFIRSNSAWASRRSADRAGASLTAARKKAAASLGFL